MSIFNWLNWKRQHGSAPIARNRLKVLLAHESARGTRRDLLGPLRAEILAVICRHVAVEPDKVQVIMDRRPAVSTLAIEVEIPA